jgi:hypothetical protein
LQSAQVLIIFKKKEKKDKLFGELIKPFSLGFFSLSQEPGFYP